MKKIAIITDSSSNLNSELINKYGVNDILPMHIYQGETKYDANGDWIGLDARDYFNNMRSGIRYTSSQILAKEYKESFEKFLSQDMDILSISCTSALSASVKESYIARDELKEKYKDNKIVCIDSANCTFSLAMLVMKACSLRDEGKTIEEIVSYIDEYKEYYNEVGTVDKLTYLRQAGRVSASAAFFAGILSVKPIIVYDEVGHNLAVEKVKGRRNSFIKNAQYVKKYADINESNMIYIAHGDCLDEAKEQADLIQEQFDEKLEFYFNYIEPGVASSTGPGTLIICFYGSPEMRRVYKK